MSDALEALPDPRSQMPGLGMLLLSSVLSVLLVLIFQRKAWLLIACFVRRPGWQGTASCCTPQEAAPKGLVALASQPLPALISRRWVVPTFLHVMRIMANIKLLVSEIQALKGVS